MGGGDGGGSLVSDVKGNREDKALGIVEVIIHSSLVPDLICSLIIDITEVTEKMNTKNEMKISDMLRTYGSFGFSLS